VEDGERTALRVEAHRTPPRQHRQAGPLRQRQGTLRRCQQGVAAADRGPERRVVEDHAAVVGEEEAEHGRGET